LKVGKTKHNAHRAEGIEFGMRKPKKKMNSSKLKAENSKLSADYADQRRLKRGKRLKAKIARL
jgi:hypothetical protein